MHHPPPHPSTLPAYLQLLDAEITGSLGNIAISSLLVSSDSITFFHKIFVFTIQHPALALDSRLLSLGDYHVPTNLHPPPSARVERVDHADRCTAVQEGVRQQAKGAFRTLSTSYLMGYGNPRRAPCTGCHSRRTLMDPDHNPRPRRCRRPSNSRSRQRAEGRPRPSAGVGSRIG